MNSKIKSTKEQKLVKDIENRCEYMRRDFEKDLRAQDNEWMLVDFWEWYNLELTPAVYRTWQAGQICKKSYQDILAIAAEMGAYTLPKMIEEYEEQEDCIKRLCNP